MEYFSEEFKDLVQAMVQLDAGQRPTIDQVYQHPWMQGERPTKEQVLAEFKAREMAVIKVMEEEKQQKKEEKLQRVEDRKKQPQ